MIGKQRFYNPDNWDKKKKDLYLNSGHVWKENEDGEVDTFATSEDIHNGPECIVCGYAPCWHCEPVPKKGDCQSKSQHP